MKDLLQRVRVDVRTSNIKIAAKRRAARAARLVFLIQLIKLLFAGRCRSRCRRHFVHSLLWSYEATTAAATKTLP